jgi:putative DNA primase/helicase
MPHTFVRQISDRAMTANMLIPDGDPDKLPNPTRRANVERARQFIWVGAYDIAPGRMLVVCQQGLERALLGGPLPDTVSIAHFNAVTGLNAWKDVSAVVVIGRTEPPVREVERIARVLFGVEVQEVEPDDKGNIRYSLTRRGIRMRDGRGIPVDGPCHPDPRVEAIRLAICEGELVQAIGRGRGVNRTEANPLRIDILTNVCLPFEVDEVTTWQQIQPGVAQIMRARGAVPLSYADMATAYPDLFPSREAAKKAIGREAENASATAAVVLAAPLSRSSTIRRGLSRETG